jgi:hypothetical protein
MLLCVLEDTTQERRRRRRAQIIRRRVAAFAVLAGVVGAAVAVPLTVHAGASERDGVAAQTTIVDGSSLSTSPVSSTASSAISTSTTSTLVEPGQPVTMDVARTIHSNELGLIPILMYHKIGNDIVPPDRLRDDIARLKAAGFYPTTIREMAEGTMDIPAGKSPVILTFDDSSPTHYKILDNGSLDPDCAVAIILGAVEAGDWAPKACFFPLLAVNSPGNIVFGQPEYAQQKLQNLVAWGFEVGSHTVTHRDLSKANPAQIHEELAQSEQQLEEMIGGGYQLYTLNPPFGEYPDDLSLLTSGEYEGLTYEFSAVVMAWGGEGFSPFSTDFNPLKIRRITAYPPETVPNVVAYFEKHPEMRYVSDGDSSVVSAPLDVASDLGEMRTDLDQRIIRYRDDSGS